LEKQHDRPVSAPGGESANRAERVVVHGQTQHTEDLTVNREAAGEGHTLTVRPVLGDVSPEVGLSEVFGLFGPDGAGKTT
jgi:ABC-type multidrug transport system ATPase subunit